MPLNCMDVTFGDRKNGLKLINLEMAKDLGTITRDNGFVTVLASEVGRRVKTSP
jgi:hypothetical protein